MTYLKINKEVEAILGFWNQNDFSILNTYQSTDIYSKKNSVKTCLHQFKVPPPPPGGKRRKSLLQVYKRLKLNFETFN